MNVIGGIAGTGDGSAWGAPPPGDPHRARERTFDLQHQIVRIAFDWSRRAVVGSTTLQVAALDRPLARVELDAVGMTIGAVNDASGAPLRHEYDGRALAIALPRPLAPHATTTFTVSYESVRPKAGVYFVERRHVVWTQGKLEDNRYWVPTYDFPNDKTTWELYVRSESGERAWAVGALFGQRPVDGGIEWHWVQATPAPTYLMTVAVGPYTTIDDSAGSTRLRYWTYPDSVDAARKGFAATPRIIDVLSRRLGIPFPSSSFDQVAVPDFIFWDALEGWRPLIPAAVQDDRLVLANEEGWPGENAEMSLARAVAAEWFGKLVTPSDWSQLWLSEGISNYLALEYAEEAHGRDATRRIRDWWRIGHDRQSRRPLVYDRWTYGPIELMLSQHVTEKGAVVLDLLRHEIGDSAFWKGLRAFLEQHAGGTVTTTDLERAMEHASGRDLTTFFRQWVYGAGNPILTVEYRYDATAHRAVITATQTQPRDSLTGYFDASVHVDVVTDGGRRREVLRLHGERSELAVALPTPPRSIRWDPDHQLLADVTFDPPKEMLLYDLEHDPDPRVRVEAVGALGRRAVGMGSGSSAVVGFFMPAGDTSAHIELPGTDTSAIAAVLHVARTDSSAEVRAAAVESFGMSRFFVPGGEAAVLAISRDPAPEVRATAAMALFGPPTPAAVARLQEMTTSDPDPEVREAALRIAITLPHTGDAAPTEIPNADAGSDSAKLRALRFASSPRSGSNGWALARQYLLDPRSGRELKESAMRTLGIAVFMSRVEPDADPAELVRLLTPFLNDDDASIRLSAARELGSAKLPAATAALESRKRVEVDARVLTQIDESLAQIARPDPDFER